jgi:glycosyltransferase involved in cell wall biosynthesis
LVKTGGVTTVHDVSFLIGPEWFKPRDRAILSRTVPASCKRASRIIAVSMTCQAEIERYIPAAVGKTRVVYNACPDWIKPIPRDEAAREVETETGVQGPYMLTVGTRWPRKNMTLALEAAAQLPGAVAQKLVVTGKPGWGEERLGERGVAVGYVNTRVLSALYSAADLYLAPSRHEGFGIPLLEAFRCGCPVLCSSGGALPEVAGDAASVETSWDPADWARRIESLLGDPSKIEDLKKRGAERERSFTWDLAARQTLDVYREAAQ